MVGKTISECVVELMREIIHKGRHRNPNRLLDLKAKALSPPKATRVEDLDKILTEWKHIRHQILEEDPNHTMSDETLQTILLKVIPQELVRDMRRKLKDGEYKDDYHGFGQCLFDEIDTRRMGDENRKRQGHQRSD